MGDDTTEYCMNEEFAQKEGLAFLLRMSDRFVAEMVLSPEGSQWLMNSIIRSLRKDLHRYTHNNQELQNIQRVLRTHTPEAKFVIPLVRKYPCLLKVLPDAHIRSLEFLTAVIQGEEKQFRTTVRNLDPDRTDAALRLGLTLHVLRQDLAGADLRNIPDEYKFSPDEPDLSLQIAAIAMSASTDYYPQLPEDSRRIMATKADCPWWAQVVTAEANTSFVRRFTMYGATFAEAAALSAAGNCPSAYRHIPEDVIRTIDARADHQFSRKHTKLYANALATPVRSPVFDDINLCCRLIGGGQDPTVYFRFTEASRRNLYVVHAFMFIKRYARDGKLAHAIAAIPQDVMLDPDMPGSFMLKMREYLQEKHVIVKPQVLTMYRQVMYAQPLALRVLNQSLFDALVAGYITTIICIRRRLGGGAEAAGNIIARVYGAKHIRRVNAALQVPREKVEAMRSQWEIPPPEPTDAQYRRAVDCGAVSSCVDQWHLYKYPEGWFSSRYIADHGEYIPPRCGRAEACGRCYRCTAERYGGKDAHALSTFLHAEAWA